MIRATYGTKQLPREGDIRALKTRHMAKNRLVAAVISEL